MLTKKLPSGVEAKARIIELKADQISEDGTIEGYLSVFGNIDGGGDIVMPGAFDVSLAKKRSRPIPILREHNPEKVIGVWTSLTPDNYGLKARGKIIDTELGTDTLKVARAGFPFGLSIGYVTVRHEIDDNIKTEWGWAARKLLEVDLWEGSVVTFAMNDLCEIESVKRAEMARSTPDAIKAARLAVARAAVSARI